MKNNSRKLIRLIIGLIWIIGSFVYFRSGNILFAVLFAIVGIIFLVSGIKTRKEY